MVNSSSENWDSFLSTVENAINNTVNITLGETSSFVLFGYDTYPSLQSNLLGTNYHFIILVIKYEFVVKSCPEFMKIYEIPLSITLKNGISDKIYIEKIKLLRQATEFY